MTSSGLTLLVLVLNLACLTACESAKPSSNLGSPWKSTTGEHRRLKVQVGEKKGYIDKTGKLVINPKYDVAADFQEGLALVCVGECTTDNILGYRYTKDFNKEMVEQSFKYGFIDESGKMVINPAYEDARDFSEGLAAVCVGQGCYASQQDKPHKWGYTDKTGVVIITPQFDVANEFHEGLASVSVAHKFGYIDKNGKFVINPQYDSADKFLEGIARVALRSTLKDASFYQSGYIDKTGKYLWQLSN